VTSNARKLKAVIQWARRTSAECRELTVVVGTAESEVGTQTESAMSNGISLRRYRVERDGLYGRLLKSHNSNVPKTLNTKQVMIGK
jgi:hypothetical protein